MACRYLSGKLDGRCLASSALNQIQMHSGCFLSTLNVMIFQEFNASMPPLLNLTAKHCFTVIWDTELMREALAAQSSKRCLCSVCNAVAVPMGAV